MSHSPCPHVTLCCSRFAVSFSYRGPEFSLFLPSEFQVAHHKSANPPILFANSLLSRECLPVTGIPFKAVTPGHERAPPPASSCGRWTVANKSAVRWCSEISVEFNPPPAFCGSIAQSNFLGTQNAVPLHPGAPLIPVNIRAGPSPLPIRTLSRAFECAPIAHALRCSPSRKCPALPRSPTLPALQRSRFFQPFRFPGRGKATRNRKCRAEILNHIQPEKSGEFCSVNSRRRSSAAKSHLFLFSRTVYV